MTERDKKTVKKLLYHIELVQEYMSLITSVDEFKNNTLVRDAVVFNLLQVGELANNHLTDSFKGKHDYIPWINIYGLRNRIVHDYYSVQVNTLYEIVQNNLQTLYHSMKEAIK